MSEILASTENNGSFLRKYVDFGTKVGKSEIDSK